jgi:hypothetical protein
LRLSSAWSVTSGHDYRLGGGFASAGLRGKNVNAVYAKNGATAAQPGSIERPDYYG